MLKVIAVVDKKGTALDRLAQGVAPYHNGIDYKVVDVHPKRPDEAQLKTFMTEVEDADIIDWQYYRTAELLRKHLDLSSKKQILTHNNPYSIHEQDWNGYDMVVANNLTMKKELKEITKAPLEYVPLTVEADFWTYNENWEANDRVIMVANRIESKKGILPVAIACADAGLKFVLVGNVSDANYMDSIMATGNVEFHENISDEKLQELYHSSTIHVCNSKDNFESGTLPILEAMLCGVPVLTRNIGHVPDLYNGKNLEILKSDPDNVLSITESLQRLHFDKKKLAELRQQAWESAKGRTHARRAYAYEKLYRKMKPGRPVSVVIPCYDRPEILLKCLDAVAEQTYKNIEVIVCNDNPENVNEPVVREFARFVDFPVQYINEPAEGYGLAKQRNLGIINATGEVIVFCDERIIMQPEAIEEFVKQVKDKTWVFGDKNGKTTFVENFSAVQRQDIINAGMFNERIDKWGGMSQEIRTRINRQGFEVKLCLGAKASQATKSRNKWKQKQDIIYAKDKLFRMGM